jgi:hypothetical protein
MSYKKLLLVSIISILGTFLIVKKPNRKLKEKLKDHEINEIISEYVYRFSRI